MDLIAVTRIAVRALARNKMRSSLTMMGIIIGVGAVIAMVGVGQGAQQQVQQQIAAMGSNMLFVGLGHGHAGWNPYGLGRHEDSDIRRYARHPKRVPGRQGCGPRQ